jgi:hypothetical protein
MVETTDHDSLLAAIPFPSGEIERLKGRAEILKCARKRSRVAEIGVYRGHFSEVIIRHLRPKIFYMVDMWTLQGEFYGWDADREYTAWGNTDDEAGSRRRGPAGRTPRQARD